MSEEEQPEPPKRQKAFDLLASVAVFARKNGIKLNDTTLVDRFMADAAPRLREALADPALIHGSRVERLFEATVLSLGQFKLLKTEDVGRVHAAETLRAPDFRIVFDDGGQWLVEVKNVRSTNPSRPELRMSRKYLESVQSYADAVGTPLKLAIYWSAWRFWSVISPEHFRTRSGGLRVSMQEAMLASEFERLGENLIMTKPPLRLVLDAATEMPRSVSDEGLANFMIASARIYSRDVELTDPKDRKLAQVFLFHGEWKVEGPIALMEGDQIAGVEFVANPVEPTHQGWEGIGMASRIFSTFYAEQTIDGDQVIQLDGEPAPDWFAPLAKWDFKNSRLPLLLGVIKPSHGT
ncbi:hypothetical protein ELI07_32775 (plasmid) [Rhizobium leguminosarum]|uniref:hypothetical protein n=1 Tax=Rhizobium leguminosarum TaxID=384 RepID=UPI001030B195|nr:hypothetical protein [Rhizobium leguminosarum]TAX01965.1 hypothetical protein ELI07_32775 [Rhizobium leguminosarum]TAZ03233.1 hypothetical protein ELH81_30930 [Rhizobium leguminosarum]